MNRKELRVHFLEILQRQGITTITRQDLHRLCRTHEISTPQWFLRDRRYKHPTQRGVYVVPSTDSPNAPIRVGEAIIHKVSMI